MIVPQTAPAFRRTLGTNWVRERGGPKPPSFSPSMFATAESNHAIEVAGNVLPACLARRVVLQFVTTIPAPVLVEVLVLAPTLVAEIATKVDPVKNVSIRAVNVMFVTHGIPSVFVAVGRE